MNCSLSDTDIEAFLMTVSVILLINIRLYDTDLILQINQIFMEINQFEERDISVIISFQWLRFHSHCIRCT